MIELFIDSRETKIIDILREKNINFHTKQLDIGDIYLIDSNNNILIIERKTWRDLSSSLSDGRYREQRSRLLLSLNDPLIKVCYLIEGPPFETIFEKERHALLRLQLAYQIPVIFSFSIYGTVETIINFINKDNLSLFFLKRDIDIDQVESRVASRKKNFDDSSLFFQQTLSNIKGISALLAKSIQNKFLSISNFCNHFQNDFHASYKDLKNLYYLTPKKNEKKINKAIIEKILFNFSIKNPDLDKKITDPS